MWILFCTSVRFVVIASHETLTHLGLRTRRKFVWIVDSSVAWSSPTLFSVSFILKQNGSWWVEPYALPDLYPAEKVHFLFPQDSHKSIGPDFQWAELGHPYNHGSQGNAKFWWPRPESQVHPEHVVGEWRRKWHLDGKIRKLLPT